MYKNIAFIGGIHGVGKSTICEEICKEIQMQYLSASELLKWKEINEDKQSKNVKNIIDTQARLIAGLKNTVQKNQRYLLDGHYCLLNNQNEIINVPLETFRKIAPISLNIILGDVTEIKDRLEKRDQKSYSEDLLAQMQKSELNYAKKISKTLKIDLNIGTQNNFSVLLTALHKTFLI